ncbi:VWA domain-containing protein [Paenibacillus sp. GCM10023252]|uniref:VWA domain-containing protein n=1 Tax=Paenibacillus sp. GCM10023252 TaxID=3252649 RepID=UPI003623B478
MNFLSPLSSLFFLTIPAILLLYMLKRTYQDTPIASHMLWNRVLREQEANRPWQRLRSRLLLLIQLLAAVLLVLALMNPAWLRPADKTSEAVIVIDRSASMLARSSLGDRTLLEQAIAEAGSWVSAQPASRPITLIVSGEQPQLIAAKVSNPSQVKELLNAIEPDYRHNDHAAALSLANAMYSDKQEGEIHYWTDMRVHDAEEMNELKLNAPLQVHTPEPVTRSNNDTSIVYYGVTAAGDSKDSKDSWDGTATIHNDSAESKTVTVHFYLEQDKQPAASKTINIPPGEWKDAAVQNLPGAAYYRAEIEQAGDPYSLDNTAYSFGSASSKVKVMLVTKGNLFLEKALQLAGVETTKLNPDQYVPSSGGKDTEADWILLDGLADKYSKDKQWAKLLDSRPVWMIEHPSLAEDRQAAPVSTAVQLKQHPVTAYLSFTDTHIGRMAKVDRTAEMDAIVTYGGVPAIYAGMKEGHPRLHFTFDLQETDLPLRPEFPVLITQAVEWMSGGSQLHLGTATAGAPIDVTLQASTTAAEWIPLHASSGLPKQPVDMDIPLAAAQSMNAPGIPGLYQLRESNEEGKVISSRFMAVRIAAAESAELARTEQQLLAPEAASEVRESSPDKPQSALLEQWVSIQGWMALLILLLIMGEWEVYRRGHAG